MKEVIDEYSFDLSAAKKFFSDAIQLAHEYGKIQSKDLDEPDKLTNYFVKDSNDTGVSIYEDLPDVSFRKFFIEKDTELEESTCVGCHKIFIIISGKLYISIDNEGITIPDDRKFCYLLDGNKYVVKALENSWCCVLSTPS